MLRAIFIILTVVCLSCNESPDKKCEKVIQETETMVIKKDNTLFKKGAKIRFAKLQEVCLD